MKILGFYKKGAHLSVKSLTPDNANTFSSSTHTDIEIGYVPKDGDKKTSKIAHDIVEHDGKLFIILNKGYSYNVSYKVVDKRSSLDVDASSEHMVVEVPVGSHSIKIKEGE